MSKPCWTTWSICRNTKEAKPTYFNGKQQRTLILANEEAIGYYRFAPPALRYGSYINLCIHPYTWEDTYTGIKNNRKISLVNWNCLCGTIMALLLSVHKKTEHTIPMIAEMAADFVDYIRIDKGNYPWRFLLSMRRYLPRYCLIKSLKTVGVDWRDVAYELLGAKHKPVYASYHSLFTNPYVRTMIKAMVVFKQMRSTQDVDYLPGVNDKHTLLLRESASTKCHPYMKLETVVDLYLVTLPSWNTSIRAKVAYYVSFLRPLHELFEKQMLPIVEQNTLGTKSKNP